jgi:hypothetical protein
MVLRSLNGSINVHDSRDDKIMFVLHLATTIIHLEEYLNFLSSNNDGGRRKSFAAAHQRSGFPKVTEAMLSLDCPRNIILFFMTLGMHGAPVLARAKEMNKERMGQCGNPTCDTYTLDKKLLTCIMWVFQALLTVLPGRPLART